MIILSIESSCDETGVSILKINNGQYHVLADFLYSQISVFKKYGGVIPEVAARNHTEKILPLLAVAFRQAEIKPEQIDLIAVTNSPGLVTSLMVGIEVAKILSYLYGKPLIAVNHLEAHLLANWFGRLPKGKLKNIPLPSLGLLVSGGHTEIILIKKLGHYKIIGQTLDDAAGESFDKIARMLKLGYPGGPAIAEKAKKGDLEKFDFPRPMLRSKNYNFSFSGLKTAVRQEFEKILKSSRRPKTKNDQIVKDIAAGFQQAVIDVLAAKFIKAAKDHRAKSLLIAGGVAANQALRHSLEAEAEKLDLPFYAPDFQNCQDNSLMIALAGYFNYQKLANKKSLLNTWKKIKADPVGRL